MPITVKNPFKGRHYRARSSCQRCDGTFDPPAYLHVSELLAERGLFVHPSCVWRWVQVYAPEINRRCRQHLKPTNRSYRVDET
jgi:transposase, IS6 family